MGFINSLVTSIAPIFIATSPITSYADQIHSIHRTKSSAGFSLDIPLIMLVASILKVLYWFGAHFAPSLLIQSLLMIAVHTLLLHIALSNRPSLPPLPFSQSPTPRPYSFWQWRSPRPYWTFLSLFSASLATLTLLLSTTFPTALFESYTSALGAIALTVEATLPLPQLLSNYKRRGCKGFRPSVIANWIVGDTFKMWYFFASSEGEVPWAFKVCGIFQAVCDLGLGVQWFVWGDGVEGGVGGVGMGGMGGKEVRSPPPEREGFEMEGRGSAWEDGGRGGEVGGRM